MEQAQQIGECLHAYGVHSFTVQPELAGRGEQFDYESSARIGTRRVVDGTSGDDSEGEIIESGVLERGDGTGEIMKRNVGCRIKCQEGGCEAPQCCD